ncbi:MAG TPA: hypothetical protein VN046_10040 [Stenotrophobium sp.]|nr:hypothetical protein [Stenotrophobium sp.]
MADEPDEDLGAIELAEPTEPEYYEVEDGYIIFPHGVEWFAECYDSSAIRVTMKKPGEIEIMDAETGQWRRPSQGKPKAKVTEIKGGKP